ncbi:MAG: TonB-dependent receptor, partial [Gemmatimonadaceae bacterium]|nr:TonB-dependent receptor [Gemmatimonadaceae bacterium]
RGALFITAGLRGDRAPNVGRQYRTTLAPRIGAAYVRQLGTVQAKFRAAYGKGIRPPISGARDGGMSAQGTVLPNPAIGPEWQTGADAGVDLAFGPWGSFSATYYDQTARDLIDLVPLDASATPAYMYQNAGSIRNTGWELDGTFSPVKAVALRGEVTVMDSRVEALSAEYTGDLRVGDRPHATPRVTSGGGIRVIPRPSTDLELFFVHTGSWTDYDYLALYGTRYGGQPRRPSQRDYLRSYPGFTKVGLTVNHRLTDRLDIFLSVENLTGSHAVEQNDVYVLPGRTTVLGTHLRY